MNGGLPEYYAPEELSGHPRFVGDAIRVAGHNVDPVDVDAGLKELAACGYDEPNTIMVITYALQRWARGEEEQAQRGAIDRTFHGIDLTSWVRVLAAAIASGTRKLAIETGN